MENSMTEYAGRQIRLYRKTKKMTLQDLADAIHKSRATVSKYENGEIVLDVETLGDISRVLNVPVSRFLDIPEAPESEPTHRGEEVRMQKSPFFQARRLFFYFYDGRFGRMKDGIIDILPSEGNPGCYEATLTICTITPNGRSSEIFYKGDVIYSDMLIRFSFINQVNTLEEDLLYIFNPLDVRDATEGLLCGISSTDLVPCAFKCLVSLTPKAPTEEFRRELLFTKRELMLCQKMNMLLVNNREETDIF